MCVLIRELSSTLNSVNYSSLKKRDLENVEVFVVIMIIIFITRLNILVLE